MDKDGNGVINLDDIHQMYNAKKHPKVMSGEMTEDEVLFEWLDTFELHHSPNPNDKRDGTITPDEWLEYY